MVDITFLRSLFVINPRRQLREMYVFLIFFSFAASLITVFEPIFFWQQGFSLWLIALYYAVHYALYVIILPIGGMFAARFGYEKSLALSAPIFVLYFLILAWMPDQPGLFWVAAIVLTLFKIFYWPAYHANFASYTDGKNMGTEQSWVRLVEYGVGIAGPLIGGFVAARWGFPVLFLLTALSLVLAGISLLWTRERRRRERISYSDPWFIIISARHRSMAVAMLGWGENLVYLAFWPVFLVLVLGRVETVGTVASLSAAAATFVGFFVGEWSDRKTPRGVLRVVAPLMALGYAARAVAFMPWQVVIGDVVARVGEISMTIPFLARLYKTGKRVGPLEYALAFEISLAIAKTVLAFALVPVFFYLPLPSAFMVTFSIAGLFSLLYRAL